MKFRFLFLLLPLLFMGCAQIPDSTPQQSSSWAVQQTQLEALTHWSLSGKLAVITPNERNSVNIHWQQSDRDIDIHLSTFLGLSVLDIKKTNDETVIIDSDGNHYRSKDSEQLINELSGMSIPVEHLQQWIKGNPHNATYQLDEQHRVSTLLGTDHQHGVWSINYSDYRPVNSIALPHKLQLTRGDIRLKFIISTWHITALH